jgi:class 3 adenylate cyclase
LTGTSLLARRDHLAAADDTYRRAWCAQPKPLKRGSVTVLFVDIESSMELSGAVELADWWLVLDDLFELMCEAVYRHDGWVGSFTGDGIKAVFESRPSRAAEAALWLRDELRRPTNEFRRRHGRELALRMGIATGEAMMGTIGSRYRRYYTASGYTVALAKRMESLARPGRIYLTEHTVAALDHAFDVAYLGPFAVRGAREPVGVCELRAAARSGGRGARVEGVDEPLAPLHVKLAVDAGQVRFDGPAGDEQRLRDLRVTQSLRRHARHA